jgi:hypothetical protein
MSREARNLEIEAKAKVEVAAWEPPRFEVLSLDCEITAYTPDDRPLF